MESGDFYTYLIDLVGEMFFAQKKEINFEKIQKHIDNAMRMTSANLDSNKDQFYFTLSNMSISMQKEHLDQYIKILDSNENDIEVITNQLKVLYNSKASINLDDMKLYECIVLESKISWPLNLIFSKKNIIKYQILFRQLMYLKLVAKDYLKDKQIQFVKTPMVRDKTAMDAAHEQAADTICGLLDQGKQVAFLTLGDPAITFSPRTTISPSCPRGTSLPSASQMRTSTPSSTRPEEPKR